MVAKPHPVECLSMSTCPSLIAVTTMVRTSVASRAFLICFQLFWTFFLVLTPQNPISSAHFLTVNFFCSVAESPTILLCIFIAFFAPCKKKQFGLWHWQWRRCCHHWYWIYLRCCHPLCFRPLSNFSFKLQFLTGVQLLRWEGYHAHVCFCGPCVFIYYLRAYPYQPFKNRADKPFQLSVLWFYLWFHIYVKLPWLFYLTTEDWGKDWRDHHNNWHRCCCFSYVHHSVNFLKLSPTVGIFVAYGHCVCPISLHLWNVYLLPLELVGL